MARTLMTAAAVAAALLATPAAAQQLDLQPAPPGTEMPPEQQRALLLGKAVWTTDGKQAGIVSDVLTDGEGKLEAVHVTLGEFLGLGEKMVRVDASLLVTDGEEIKVKLSADELGMLPEVARNA